MLSTIVRYASTVNISLCLWSEWCFLFVFQLPIYQVLYQMGLSFSLTHTLPFCRERACRYWCSLFVQRTVYLIAIISSDKTKVFGDMSEKIEISVVERAKLGSKLAKF